MRYGSSPPLPIARLSGSVVSPTFRAPAIALLRCTSALFACSGRADLAAVAMAVITGSADRHPLPATQAVEDAVASLGLGFDRRTPPQALALLACRGDAQLRVKPNSK